MLLRQISRFKLPEFSSRYFIRNDLAPHMGILTILFGLTFMILGTPILADSFYYLSEKLQEEVGMVATTDAEDTNDSTSTKKNSSLPKVVVKTLAAMITMSMLWWAIFTGIRLTTEPRRGSKYYSLTVSVGVVTVIFGSIYFVIGLAIIADLCMELAIY